MREKYFADDRPIKIPDHIKNMSKEELDAEIARLEAKARAERNKIRQKK